MAHLNYHGKIVKRWKHNASNTRYHLTETNWLLRTDGQKMGGATVVTRPKETEKRSMILNKIESMAECGTYIEEVL